MVWLRVTARGTVLKGLSSTKVENRYSRRDDIVYQMTRECGIESGT